ncbi:MAG: exopolysaccharide biosynthesis protein [Alphaproteobacteria bacterium]|nr:exopolysaccharide biosynthesis protein [Alphaproteobacteria bacterium]
MENYSPDSAPSSDTSPPRPLSALLQEIHGRFSTQTHMTIAELLEAFHERGFGFFLFLISLPAAWPFPGLGLHQIAGIPLVVLSWQMMVGNHTLWLPDKFKLYQMETKLFLKLISHAMPWVKRFENITKPRLAFMTSHPGSNIVGVMGILMAICITVPFPFSNTLPALCLAVIAIGLLMRDGLAILLGTIIGGVWSLMIFGLIAFFGMEGLSLLHQALTSLF